MIYLNKVCFNGLYRVNRKGEFNVPMGKWKKLPTICDEENLRACSLALRGEVCVVAEDFRDALARVCEGDFVYLDPPYVPLTKTANFTRYTKEGFGPQDQNDLAVLVKHLKEKGAHVLMSNAGNQTVRDLYPAPFFKVEEISALRKINCQAGKRGEVVEFLIS
jgi:DNA adenine methylase